MATLGNLPDELMVEIITRLPPAALSRSKSVSKSWYALINSLQHKSVFLKRLLTTDSGRKHYTFSILKFPLSLDRPVSVHQLDLPFAERFSYLEICGHSHGLLCLTNRTTVFLCNPTTRALRELPPSILLFTDGPSEPYGHGSSCFAVGFGYDARSRDFKVVRVVDFTYGFGQFSHQRLEIYSLRQDRWREIETPLCGRHVYWSPSFEMYHDGTYYWSACAGGYTEIIQSFDISAEVFATIRVPATFEEPCEKVRGMGVLNGSVVLFHYPPKGSQKTFDVWAMESDRRGRVSWSKLLTIGPISGIELCKPLMFVSSDQLLMEAGDRQVVLYNVKTQHVETQLIKELPIKGNFDIYGHPDVEATLFVESSMSVEGGNNVINYEF